MGDAEFLRKLDGLFREELRNGSQEPAPECPPVSAPAKAVCRLRPPLGDLAPSLARQLADAVETAGAHLRIGLQHDVLIYGNASPELRPALQKMTVAPHVVSCPGAAWCSRGIADSRGTAESLHKAWPADCGLGVVISGCPNNCSHAGVAEIGLVGRIRTVNGVRQECYRLFAGGGAGKSADLASELHPCVPAALVPEAVGRLAQEYRRSGAPGESFAAFVLRAKERLAAVLAEKVPAA
jgi:sulfite reductase beta subunit-like hemoprotein